MFGYLTLQVSIMEVILLLTSGPANSADSDQLPPAGGWSIVKN
jgi:hypothetical protein